MADLNDFWGDESFDDIGPSTGTPDPVPPGDYTLKMDSSEPRQTKDQTGMMLACVFSILDPEYEGRKVFTNFNIRNKSDVAQRIGIADFKALCMACGIEFADARADTAVLLDVPFMAKIGMSKARDGYEPRNEIKKYYPAGGAAAPAPAPVNAPPQARPAPNARPAATAAPAGQRAAPSWMKKTA